MKNCEMKLNDNILTTTVDISKGFGVSSSGKSIIIGSTEFDSVIIAEEIRYSSLFPQGDKIL